ncbi:hypothetical protein MTR67_028722 [Solanum verrucosum]|uniref:DUF674 domain-containing protein n=1 Tax=Solanum verrucosum TaxID=315347 RepID=A0AAF0R2Z6_SOLVR|nr:hypothetical protein MTR67_028722 [Solanum verrucosum]
MTTCNSKLSLKLLIDSKAKRVVFAEAEKDCVDFLFHILSLPLSTLGSFLALNDVRAQKTSYICASAYVCGSTTSTYVTDDPNCRNRMSRKLTYLAPQGVKEPVGITGLNKYFNAKDVGSLQEKVVNLGMAEALKASFESKTVLTSVFMSSAKCRASGELYAIRHEGIGCFSLLATVIKLLKKKGMNYGCLPKLYDSVEKLNDTYIQSKDILLKPKSSVIGMSSIPFLSIDDVPTTHKTFYSCSSSNHYNHLTVSDDPSAKCTSCQCPMSRRLIYVAPPIANGAVASTSGFVKDVVTYMVMDDLVIKLMSTISSITLLNKFNVKDVGVLQEEVVNFGMEEALKLLKASFESKTVLTSVFMSLIKVSK